MKYEYAFINAYRRELEQQVGDMASAGWRLTSLVDIATPDDLPLLLCVFEREVKS